MTAALRLISAMAPLAITPLLLFAIAEGYLSFGGGEKDLILLVPWTIWSLAFGVSALLLWARRWPHRRALVRSAAVGIGVVVLVFAVLAAFGRLGVANRF